MGETGSSVLRLQIREDRLRGAAPAAVAESAVDQRGAGEAEVVAQREHTVGQRVRRSVAVDIERRQRDEAAREGAVEVAVLILAVPGDREAAESIGGDGRVALNAGD